MYYYRITKRCINFIYYLSKMTMDDISIIYKNNNYF